MSRTRVRTISDLRQEVSKGIALFDTDLLQSLIEELAEHPDPLAPSTLYTAKGMMHRLRDENEEALKAYKHAVEEYQRLGDNNGMAGSITNIGAVHADAGDFATAYEYFNEALKLHIQTGNRLFEANTLHNLGMIHVDTGGYSQGVDFLNRALEIYEGLHDDHSCAVVTGHLGKVNHMTGDNVAAMEKFTRALDVYTTSGDRLGVAQMYSQMAGVHSAKGEFRKALTKYRDAREIYIKQSAPDRAAAMSASVFMTLTELGELDAAAAELTALNSADLVNTSTVIARMECNAQWLTLEGQFDVAQSMLEEAMDMARANDQLSVQAMLNKRLRDLAFTRRDIDSFAFYNDEMTRLHSLINTQETAQKLAMNEAQQRINSERAERERERAILFSTLPEQIAERLVRGESVRGDLHRHVAVLFVDIAEFTAHSEHLDPEELTDLIEEVFAQFDDLCEMYDLTKIKTIGDSYMAVAFPTSGDANAAGGVTMELRASRCALDMLRTTFTWPNGERVMFRAGIHSGPVVAGVIGSRRIQYDVWGDTVNVASRMESTGEIGKVQITEGIAQRVRHDDITMEQRTDVDVKGKGFMTTYLIAV